MLKVKEVIVKYHEKVKFPWTIRKIKKAKLQPTEFLLGFGKEIAVAPDVQTPEGKAALQLLKDLKMMV